ncbi:MAG: hypothetical protein ACFFCD_02380 [Promethearchaeota archaeon]
MEEQLIEILQGHPGEPFSHAELLKLTKTKSRTELKKILGKLIKEKPDNFGSKKVGRIAVVWARESKEALPTVSDESDGLKKHITQLEKENQKLRDELKKKESKKEEIGSKSAEEIKDKLLEDLIDTLTEEFPPQIATRNQLKQFFKEVIPVVLKRYF